MKSFSKLVKENGGRALPLKVKGAFHSPFMKEAAKAFHAVLESTTIKQKQFPLYSDLTAMPYAENVRAVIGTDNRAGLLGKTDPKHDRGWGGHFY